MTDTLDAFVRNRLAETARSNPGLHASLQEVGGMLLVPAVALWGGSLSRPPNKRLKLSGAHK